MPSRASASRWRVVLLAAARLASLYAIGAALLLLPVFFWYGGSLQAVQDLKDFATPIVVSFGVAFVLLGVARRAGLVALWLVLAALWVLVLRGSRDAYDPEFTTPFVLWSILALPLAFLGGVGVPTTLRIHLGRWKPTALSVTLALWATLLVPALAAFLLRGFRIHPLQEAAIYRLANTGGVLWALGPLLIVALSIAHVWVGTAPTKVEAPAA